jgi:hypothetical protein
MKNGLIVTAVGLSVLSACAQESEMRVNCGPTDVFLTEDQAAAIATNVETGTFGESICAVADGIDATSYVEPQAVTVTMPSGNTYDVRIQATPQ